MAEVQVPFAGLIQTNQSDSNPSQSFAASPFTLNSAGAQTNPLISLNRLSLTGGNMIRNEASLDATSDFEDGQVVQPSMSAAKTTTSSYHMLKTSRSRTNKQNFLNG